jgi:hypothetical protein
MIFLLALLPLMGFTQDFTQKSLTVGARSSYFTNLEEWDNTFLYYIPEYADETFGEKIGQRRKFKLRVLDYSNSDEKVIVDPLDVSMEFFSDRNSFQIGFLRYRFSETFGLQLLDVANPRDYSEFIFNDLSWSKRSVFGMNDTFKWNNFQIQFILTLWPNGDRLPYRDTAFDSTSSNVEYQGGVVERPWFKDLEYGTRMKYLFENGLDISFLYFHHFSRPTFQEVKIISLSQFTTRPTQHMVDSFGTSASYVWNEWVLRGDALFTLNDLVMENLSSYNKDDHFQTLVGIDRNFESFILGLQSQSDFTIDRHFYGIRFEYSDVSWWKPSAMVFQNYQSTDQWFQLKSLFEIEDWKLSVSYDGIHGGKDNEDLFGVYRKNDRYLVDLSYTY